MSVKVCVLFDHRGRAQKDKEGPVEIRITYARKPYYINTGVHVRRDEWLGSVINRSDAKELNERLRVLVKRVQEMVNEMLADGREIDVAEIRQRLYTGMSDEASDAFLNWIEQSIGELSVKEGTRNHYKTLLMRLTEWGKIKKWRDVTVENIYAFDTWLHGLEVKVGFNAKHTTKLSDGAVYNYHKCLKALLSKADKLGKIERNPYERLRGEFAKGDRQSTEFLTEDEMQAFMSLRPKPGSQMAVAKDLFVFQMFTGLAYSDAQAFDMSQYKKVKGEWRMTGQRIKTGTPFVSQLLPPAVEVLERYGWRVPRIGNADYNHALKALGMAAGIDTRLHSHLARHTFATWMLRQGVKIENVSKMLGHTNITQTQRYAKVLAESVHDDFEKVRNAMMSSDEVATDNK